MRYASLSGVLQGGWVKEFAPYGEIGFWACSNRVQVEAMEACGTHIKVAGGGGYLGASIAMSAVDGCSSRHRLLIGELES
uniref:Uncharacterized protein n=1 Tax=Ignisphaera aggregans TaxID=334771 RepID=A0A7C4FG28_9CREN